MTIYATTVLVKILDIHQKKAKPKRESILIIHLKTGNLCEKSIFHFTKHSTFYSQTGNIILFYKYNWKKFTHMEICKL